MAHPVLARALVILVVLMVVVSMLLGTLPSATR